jgi:short-subunit dehydrogenase
MSESKGWALILGASSGMGGATALELSRNGFDIFGVHFDLRTTLPNAQAIMKEIEDNGRRQVFFNITAADEAKRADAVQKITDVCAEDGSFVRVLMHSLAFGTLLPVFADTAKEKLSPFSVINGSTSLATSNTNGRSSMGSECTSRRPAAILAKSRI